jgi:hypothetical protein
MKVKWRKLCRLDVELLDSISEKIQVVGFEAMDFAMKDWAIDSPKEKHFRDLMRKGYLDIVGAYFSFSEALDVAKDLVNEAKEKECNKGYGKRRGGQQ